MVRIDGFELWIRSKFIFSSRCCNLLATSCMLQCLIVPEGKTLAQESLMIFLSNMLGFEVAFHRKVELPCTSQEG